MEIVKVSVAVKRTFDLLELYKSDYSNNPTALGGKVAGKWKTYSSEEYVENTNNISHGLLSLGIKKGDIIATVATNRPEWNFVDLGIAQIGAVHLPIYPTNGTDDYKHILRHSEAKYIIIGNKTIYKKIEPIIGDITTVEKIFSFEETEGVNNYSEILAAGKNYTKKDILPQIKASIKEDDFATLLYTSGTTGTPKGVMLSHKNLVSNFTQHCNNHQVGKGAVALSFLPLCHILERTMNYHYQYKGMSVYYVSSLAGIIPALKEVKPNIFTTVPRVLERIYDGIIHKGKEFSGIKKKLFFWAVELGDNFDYGKKFDIVFKIKRNIADKLVYSKWREFMGGNINVIISGGAALQPRIGKVLGIAGINALEGYGLTETAPVIAVSNQTTNEIRVGTVGPALPGIDLKIAEDGEIICKGPNIMIGYYKASELNSEVIDEKGYFHTGDVGELVEGKYLRITDRKKEIFKLSSGKYIAPQSIENKLKESFFIEQAMVIGENQKFASALIVPNFQYIEKWCNEKNIEVKGKDALLENKDVIKAIQTEVRALNKTLGDYEEIKRYKLVADEWTPENGMLSPTLKLKRKILLSKYKHIVDNIF